MTNDKAQMTKEIQTYEARLGVSVGLSEGLPADIQWMPPGQHTINALKNGKPERLTVTATAAVAQRLNQVLQELRSKAAAGSEDLPYFDLNHDDREASGHPIEFFWGGDDLKTGGVRAKVEWSEAGKSALQGKTYRRFSPTFAINDAGEITGAGVNMGGLVNRAAFKQISAIWSRSYPDGAKDENRNEPYMDEETKKQFAALVAAVAALTTTVNEIKAKQAEKNPELLEIKTKLATMEELQKVQAKDKAAEIVAKAASTGKIPPQNEQIKKGWIEAIEKDPKAAELLLALPDNPALARVTAGAGGGTTTSTSNAGEHEFVVKAKAVAAEKKITIDQAHVIVATENPALYDEFRDTYPKK